VQVTIALVQPVQAILERGQASRRPALLDGLGQAGPRRQHGLGPVEDLGRAVADQGGRG
jgi:hypothetical protein